MSEKLVKLPNGTAGIVLSAVNESQQEDLFFPCDNRLVAVNVNGDPECGTLVYDLNGNSELDRDRGARLQSAFRILKEPLGFDNAIAFQLGPTGKGDAECGWFFDIPTGGDPQNLAVANGSYRWQGFFHPGHKEDKHKLGEDADHNPINPEHIWIKSLFYKSKDEDGELLEEKIKKPIGTDLEQRIPVHFSWDKEINKWRWWTTTPLNLIPLPLEPNPRRPGHTGGDGPGVATTGISPIPSTPAVPFTVERSTGSPPLVPGRTFVLPVSPIDATGQPAPLQIQSSSTTGNAMRILATFGEAIAAPAQVYRPQNYATGNPDILFQPQPSDTAKNIANAKANSSPLTGMCSAFGAQGGTTGSGSGASYTGPQGDPWVLTSIPSGQTQSGKATSKYPGGTASGGIVYHPPETDLRDAPVGMAPANVTLSTMYVLTAPGAYFGCGVPELVNGRIKDGYSWGIDAATGDLLWRSHSASAAPVSAFTFTKTSQNMRWYSAQSFYGEIDHANTANRVYTFPNLTGTVVLATTPASGLFTAGSVIFAASNGSLTENNGSFFWDNTAFQLKLLGTVNPQLNLLYDSTNNATFQVAATGLLTISGTGASGGAVAINKWLNVGTTTNANTQGAFSSGLTGAARLFYDVGTPAFYWYDAAGNLSTQISQSTSIITIFNASLLSVDFQVRGTSNYNLIYAKASSNAIGCGTSSPRRMLDVLDASNPQLRLTQQDNTLYADFQVDTTPDLLITQTGAGKLQYSRGANDIYIRVYRQTGGAGGGTAGFRSFNDATDWFMGCNFSGSIAGSAFEIYNITGGKLVLGITNTNSLVLNNAALATNATDGFLYIASCAGAPTGVPTAFTGRVPMVYDSTNNNFYIYNGAWKKVALA